MRLKRLSVKGQTPHTSRYLWEGNRLLQESTPNEQRTYVWEPDSFIPMLRIDDERGHDEELSKQELPALDTQAMEPKNASNLEGDEQEADDFASLKAQAWGRMVPGQINEHLAGLRSKAEQLQNPKTSPPPSPAASCITTAITWARRAN